MSLFKRSFSVWLPDNVSNSVCTVKSPKSLETPKFF